MEFGNLQNGNRHKKEGLSPLLNLFTLETY